MPTTLDYASIAAVANGVTPIPFSFQGLSATEVGVARNGVEQVGGFTVVMNADGTGTITPTSSWGTDAIVIFSKPSFSNQTNFGRFVAWYPDQLVPPIDRLARMLIAVQDGIGFDRAYHSSERAGGYAAWDAGGKLYKASGTGNDAALRTDLAAITGAALVGVGGSSTIGDIIRVNAAKYGFRPGRTAAQNLTALTDAITANGGGAHPVVIDVPPATYAMDALAINAANIWIDAHGSTFTEGGRISTSPTASGFRLKNARFYLDTNQAILTVNSSGGGLQNVDLVKFGAGDGYMAMTEQSSDNVFTGLRFTGGNGMFIEAERTLLSDIHGVGRVAGGDDFLVLKARNRRTGDINVVGVSAKNYSNGLAIGSEVGTLGAASASRAGRVENVCVRAMVLTECTYGVYAKPGAVDAGASYDWRDGLFRGFDIEIKITDATGAKMARAAVFSPARNALIEQGRVKVIGEGRFAATGDTECWAHVFMPDSTGWVAGGAGGIIRDVYLDVAGFDIYGGVDTAGPTPGNPPMHGVFVEKQAAGVGTVERIRIKARIDGTKSGGIVIGPGLANAVLIEQLLGRNLCNNPPSTSGGIHAESVASAPGENEIHMANTASNPVYDSGGNNLIGRHITVDLDAPAGTDNTLLRRLPHDTWLRSKVTGVSKDAVGASGSAYLSIELRAVNGLNYDGTAQDGNPLTTFTTAATAITAFVPFDFPAMPVNAGAGSAFADRFLKANSVLRFLKTNVGGGQSFVGSIDLHYVQIGPRV